MGILRTRSKRTTEEGLKRLAKSIRFRTYCRLHGLSELPKCMEALTNNNITATETGNREQALSNKIKRWDDTKIEKSKSKIFLSAMFYIMIKVLIIDKAIENDPHVNIALQIKKGQIHNDITNVITELKELESNPNLGFNGCQGISEKIGHIQTEKSKSVFTEYINELVKKINSNNLQQLEIFESNQKQPRRTIPKEFNTKDGKSHSQTEVHQKQEKRVISFLLPFSKDETDKQYPGYWDLFKHGSKPNTYYGTLVEDLAKDKDKDVLVPDFSAKIDTVDKADLAWLDLAIKQLKLNKGVICSLSTTSRLELNEETPKIKKDDFKKILEQAAQEVSNKQAQFTVEDKETEPPPTPARPQNQNLRKEDKKAEPKKSTPPKANGEIVHLILPHSYESTTYFFRDYIKNLFQNGNENGPYHGILVRHVPGKVEVDDDYPIILIPDFAALSYDTIKRYEGIMQPISAAVKSKGVIPPNLYTTGKPCEYTLSATLKEVEYKDLDEKVLKPARDRINQKDKTH